MSWLGWAPGCEATAVAPLTLPFTTHRTAPLLDTRVEIYGMVGLYGQLNGRRGVAVNYSQGHSPQGNLTAWW